MGSRLLGWLQAFGFIIAVGGAPVSALALAPLLPIESGIGARTAEAGPVRLTDPALIAAAELRFSIERSALGLGALGPNEHWLEGVRVNEFGEIDDVSIGSMMGGVDQNGRDHEILCHSTWQRSDGNWVFKADTADPNSCGLLSLPHPARTWTYVADEWYPMSGIVNRSTFIKLYGRFEAELQSIKVYNPSWTRDAWILRSKVDSALRVSRVGIYASAVLDRFSLNVEKRADCSGESYWNEISGWEAPNTASCRVQVYRYVRTCFSSDPRSCEMEWLPCEGKACFDKARPCERDPLRPECPKP